MLITSFARRRQRLRRRRDREAQRTGLVGGAVPDHHFVPERRQPLRDRRAHPSRACESDFHSVKTTLVSIPTDTIPLDGAWHEPDSENSARLPRSLRCSSSTATR